MSRRIRRLVVWADFTPESDRAAQWAARHAEARGLSLHLLHPAEIAVPAAHGEARAAEQPRPAEAAYLALTAHQLNADHHGLSVTTQIAEDGHGRPAAEHLELGDVLVTGSLGYRELGAGPGAEPMPAASLGVPIVVVPADPRPVAARRRVVLLTGSRLTQAAAAFAFAAAADLGATLEVVSVMPQSAAFGDDYWIDATHQPYRAESRLKADLDAAQHQYPQVPLRSATLRIRPWDTLRTMAGSAQLTVLPTDHRTTVTALDVLLGSHSCPVALVPPA